MRMTKECARAILERLAAVVAGPAAQARRSWQRLRRDAAANVTLVFGFCAIGVVGSVGIAIDTSVAYNVRSQLASAVDAAALAGARAFAKPDRDTDIENFFAANFQAGYMGATLQPLEIASDNEARTVTVTGRATIPTYFMGLFGRDSTDISATTEATLSSRDVEVSLVLDVTKSMDQYNRIGDLRDAANELVDIVVQDLQEPFYSKVAIVPYSVAVNVGSYADQIRGSLTSGLCTYPAEPTCTRFRFPDATWSHTLRTYDATTCVTERPGANIATDAAPNVALLGPHYDDGDTLLFRCSDAPIMPLSSNKEALHGVIDSLTANGYTAGHLGIAWGWYMISPNFGYLWPAESQPKDYGEIHLGQEVMKVVIIMTDGEFNTFYFDGVVAKNADASGNDHKINVNGSHGNSFAQGLALCTNMKAEGVIVYTVGLSVPSAAGFLTNCATSAEHVYLPANGAELKQAFRDIAVQVSNLRISM